MRQSVTLGEPGGSKIPSVMSAHWMPLGKQWDLESFGFIFYLNNVNAFSTSVATELVYDIYQ